MTSWLPFKENKNLTMGVELELQLVNLQSFNLTMEAKDFLRRLASTPCTGEIKPEITQSMIEINSSVHHNHKTLLTELKKIRDTIAREAETAHLGVCGGGSHPFQKWKEQRIFQTERFSNVSEQYGFLAQQFTVFGQHIHIGCPNGDDAIYLCHALASYMPHFIALAASSPFNQGVDTSFDCSRLTVISAFPLSGTPPWLMTWRKFEIYYKKLVAIGIVQSMKDFYWDIRPKPEFGTIELRICDTPLTVEKAADLAAFAQLLVAYLIKNRPPLSRKIYLTYLINRFRASRYGLQAIIIDPLKQIHKSLAEDILSICDELKPYADEFDSHAAIQNIKAAATRRTNDAFWLRQQYASTDSLNDVVRQQTEIWSGKHHEIHQHYLVTLY